MILKKRFLSKTSVTFLILFFSAACAYGQTPTTSSVGSTGLEVDFYAGASRNTTSNTDNITFPPYETDTLTGANKNSSSFVPGAGVNYNYIFSRHDYFFVHGVSLGVNYYHTGASRDGQVYQYGYPRFNNYTYKMGVSSNRVMLDGQVALRPLWHGLTIFGEAGIGDALNNTSYNEKSVLGNGGQLELDGNTRSNFASEFGGGIKMPITEKSEISIRYLYANLGKAESNTASDGGRGNLSKPISTDLVSQSLLAGYAYHLG